MQAVTPVPHEVTTGLSKEMPAEEYVVRSPSLEKKPKDQDQPTGMQFRRNIVKKKKGKLDNEARMLATECSSSSQLIIGRKMVIKKRLFV